MTVRAIGINHVSLEVGDVEAALEWYGGFLRFELRGRAPGGAWIDLGDQFLALTEDRRLDRSATSGAPLMGRDGPRHFGLVVEDKERLRGELGALGIPTSSGRMLRITDPWGNVVEIVDYREIQFTKVAPVLSALGVGGIAKSEAAIAELADRGIASS